MSRTETSTSSTIKKGAIAGLIAGMVLAMWAMIIGAFTPGSGLLAPPQGIAQALGIGVPGHQVQAVPVIVGLMLHMMNSAVLGIVFALLVAKLAPAAKIVAGMMFGIAVYVISFYAILRGVLSANAESFLTANPTWSWFVAHLMFGVALGGLLAYGPLALSSAHSNHEALPAAG